MSVSPSSGQTHLEAKCYHLLTVVIALPNLGFVTCFFLCQLIYAVMNHCFKSIFMVCPLTTPLPLVFLRK